MSLLSFTSQHSGSATSHQSEAATALRKVVVVLLASAFVAACAHISVPLPGTPVPFTLQPLAVILVGMLLGPSAGFCALAVYLLEGAAGLPVFTPAGLPGVARLVGPSAGYLFAYPLAAALAGAFSARFVSGWRRVAGLALGGTLAMLLVYTAGAAWFSHLMHMSFSAALQGAVLPFLLADVVKVFIATGIAAQARRTA